MEWNQSVPYIWKTNEHTFIILQPFELNIFVSVPKCLYIIILAFCECIYGPGVICKSSLHHPCIIWIDLNMLIPTWEDTELTVAALQAMWAQRDPVNRKVLMLLCCNDSNSNNVIMLVGG